MGQAKRRGTFEQRKAQSASREIERRSKQTMENLRRIYPVMGYPIWDLGCELGHIDFLKIRLIEIRRYKNAKKNEREIFRAQLLGSFTMWGLGIR